MKWKQPVYTEETKDAIRWFIERFIHSPRAVDFAMRDHGLMKVDQQQMYSLNNKSKRAYHARYEFLVVAVSDDMKAIYPIDMPIIDIIPCNATTSWCFGSVYLMTDWTSHRDQS